MPFLRQIARAYLEHQVASPPPRSHGRTDRHVPTEDPTPLRWIRDLGFDLSSGRDPQSGVRASDAVREQVVTFLKRHCTEGRLSTDELTSRVEAAYSAVRFSELDRLSTDLPGSPFAPVAPPAPRPSHAVAPLARAGGIALGLVVLVGLLSMLAPPEVWATLLMLFVPLAALGLFTILPFALPVVALLFLARAGSRRPAWHQGHSRHTLLSPAGAACTSGGCESPLRWGLTNQPPRHAGSSR